VQVTFKLYFYHFKIKTLILWVDFVGNNFLKKMSKKIRSSPFTKKKEKKIRSHSLFFFCSKVESSNHLVVNFNNGL
jgi:hypothetical protein